MWIVLIKHIDGASYSEKREVGGGGGEFTDFTHFISISTVGKKYSKMSIIQNHTFIY